MDNDEAMVWTESDEAELQRLRPLLKKYRRLSKADKTHDLKFMSDLLDGEAGERRVMAAIEKGEVKRDFGVSKSGNVFVEFESYGKPSGLAATESDWFIYVLDGDEYRGEVMVGLRTERLKRIADNFDFIRPCGDHNASKGKLIKLFYLIAKDSDI